MLTRENYTAEHIAALRRSTGADPSILERTVFAFGLLEAIRKVEMPFIFKGGTSLLVLLDSPRRLSTDIDIIVEPGTDVDAYIEKAGTIFPFTRVEENRRKGDNSFKGRKSLLHAPILSFRPVRHHSPNGVEARSGGIRRAYLLDSHEA